MGLILPISAGPALAEATLFAGKGFNGARLTLAQDEPNIRFAARSASISDGQLWLLCPRPFFGGGCLEVSSSQRDLRLPRRFSGVVQSARPLPAAKTPETDSASPPDAGPEADKPPEG